MVSNGVLMLDRLRFYFLRSIPFEVVFGCVRAKSSVQRCIYDDVVMNVVVKGDVFEFICRQHTKTEIVFCVSCQDWFEFIVIYKAQMQRVNITKKIRWEGI